MEPDITPIYIIEDARAPMLPDDHGKATELDVLGESYTYRSLMQWRDSDAHLFRYDQHGRRYIGPVDDILDGIIRPPLE